MVRKTNVLATVMQDFAITCRSAALPAPVIYDAIASLILLKVVVFSSQQKNGNREPLCALRWRSPPDPTKTMPR